MKSFFITGTDTDCGKTYTVCALLSYMARQQKKAMALKPIASGCFFQDGVLVNEDELRIQSLNPVSGPVSYRKFKAPVSPHLAARAAHEEIVLEELAAFCQEPRDGKTAASCGEKILENRSFALDYLFIEGAGGLMVPLNEHETWIDFLHMTQIPVIIVVGMRLGCLNHALLTTSVLSDQGIACAGWIANCLNPDLLMLEENIETLKQKIEAPLLGRIAFNGVFDFNLTSVRCFL